MSDSMSTRDFVLDTAQEIINGERAALYGDAKQEFYKVASVWSAVFGWDVIPEQIPQAMILLKMIRMQQSPTHTDSYVDVAGYAALAAEVARCTPNQ